MIKEEDLCEGSAEVLGKLFRSLVADYRARIDTIECRAVKRDHRDPTEGSGDIIVVSEGEGLAAVCAVISWEPFLDREKQIIILEPTSQIARRAGREPRVTSLEHALEMAHVGIIRVAKKPEELGELPEEWRPYVIPFDRLNEEGMCRILREPLACFVSYDLTECGRTTRRRRCHG
jgi:hypothetical protein